MLNDSEVYKKVKYINILGIVSKNQNFCIKSFNFSIPINHPSTIYDILFISVAVSQRSLKIRLTNNQFIIIFTILFFFQSKQIFLFKGFQFQ